MRVGYSQNNWGLKGNFEGHLDRLLAQISQKVVYGLVHLSLKCLQRWRFFRLSGCLFPSLITHMVKKNKSDTDFPCSDLVLLFCFLPQYDLDLTSLYSLISCRQQLESPPEPPVLQDKHIPFPQPPLMLLLLQNLIILVVLHWTFSSFSMLSLCWGTKMWTQQSKSGVTNAIWAGRIPL